ncbi:MAG: peptidyl-prolyl cis-trans isomerase [Acidobacteriota bacterium]|jgi:parvulin-like peptidyl-prolyl isomerase|nr:peptidyl-prolyl cis-trans isomerase [Acidobacteriota bacterium]
MNQKTLPRLTILGLGLALLLASWIGCKPGDKKGETTPGATPGTATSATHGQPAQPGQTPPAGSPTFSITPPSPAGNGVTPDKMPDVVAKVNGQSIKKDDLVKGAQVVRMRMAQAGQPIALTPQFYRQVLDELIGITLLQQEAKAQGVTPTDQEVERQVAARKGQFPSEDVYKKALQQAGLTEALLRQQAKEQMAAQKYVESKVVPNVNVTEQATKDFYEQNKDKIHSPERMHLRHILIGFTQQASPADKAKAKAKAEDLLKQIQGGADFAKLAQANSEDPSSKANGGDLGWVSPGQVPPAFEQAAQALKPNQVSPVVESPFGYHIIQLLERQASAAVPYEQVKDRIGAMLKQKQAQEMIQARIKELRAKGKVEVYI